MIEHVRSQWLVRKFIRSERRDETARRVDNTTLRYRPRNHKVKVLLLRSRTGVAHRYQYFTQINGVRFRPVRVMVFGRAHGQLAGVNRRALAE